MPCPCTSNAYICSVCSMFTTTLLYWSDYATFKYTKSNGEKFVNKSTFLFSEDPCGINQPLIIENSTHGYVRHSFVPQTTDNCSWKIEIMNGIRMTIKVTYIEGYFGDG